MSEDHADAAAGQVDDAPAERPVIRPSPALGLAIWPGRIDLPLLGGTRIGRAELELLGAFAGGRHKSVRRAVATVTAQPVDMPLEDLARKLLRRGGLVRVDTEAIGTPDRVEPTPGPTFPDACRPDARLTAPLTVRAQQHWFEIVGHDGTTLIELSIDEVLALPLLAMVVDDGAPPPPRTGLTSPEVERLRSRLDAVGLMTPDVRGTSAYMLAPGDADARVRTAFADSAARADRHETEREARAGRRRTNVVPVSFTSGPPLALGSIFAHCLEADDGALADRFHFRLDWEWDDARLDTYTTEAAVFMCSAYVWSHVRVLAVAAAAKHRSPGCLVVVGGPDAPKREGDAARYLHDHPEVDVLVRGEGEQTALELLGAVRRVGDGFDTTGLIDVAGLTFRRDDELIRTPDRPRLDDLDVLPSPFLTGLFDTYLLTRPDQVILETNRGCPYGCTFCDWGSATQSRIRQFDLDRVLNEIEWVARAKARTVSLADANFGIFARDVTIAEHVTAMHRATSYPQAFGANFAKNTVKHLGPIIRTLVAGGIVNRGLLALQSMDDETLDTIERSNIKVEKYDAIAVEMRAAGLPFAVELMMGLPGATLESFKDDLQQCIDREVEGTVNPTSVLVNSPMNAPAYRHEHQIETALDVAPGNHSLVVSAASFTRDDYRQMQALRRAFLVGENFGVTRHVDRLVRHASGMREIDFLAQLREEVVTEPSCATRHPFLSMMFGMASPALVTPISWQFLIDDLVAYVRETLPGIDPAELRTVARVQHALLPAHDRHYPETVELEHDYPAWFSEVVAVKERGHRHDWPQIVPPLSTFGPGTLHVDDPRGAARGQIGCSVDHGPLLASWEHQSEVSRALFATSPQA